MLLPALYTIGQSYLGTYDSTIGLPGAGGVKSTISLEAGGAYQYRNRGCFSDVSATGRYRIGPGFVTLQPPSTYEKGARAWDETRCFRIVWEKGDAYLLEEKDLPAFAESAAKGDLKHSTFFVKAQAPTLSLPFALPKSPTKAGGL